MVRSLWSEGESSSVLVAVADTARKNSSGSATMRCLPARSARFYAV